MPRKSKRKGRKGGNPVERTDRLIVESFRGTGSVASDIMYKRQNMNIVQSPPKQIGNQIYWLKTSFQTTVAVNASTIVEQNYSFLLSSFPGSGSLATAFDQFCIYAVCVTAMYQANANSVTDAICPFYSAIDYDNVNSITNLTSLQQFGSYSVTQLSASLPPAERFIKPCVTPDVFSSGFGAARMWIDMASNASVQHYGFRSFIGPAQILSSGSPGVILYNFNGIIGLRNNF